jgi:hypothetical protein
VAESVNQPCRDVRDENRLSRSRAVHKAKWWYGQIERWRASGQSQRVYRTAHELALSTFQLWHRKLRGAGTAKPTFDIVPVALVGRPAVLTADPVPLGGPVVLLLQGGRYRLELNDGFSGQVLQ